MPTNNFKIFDENKQNMYTDQEYNSATQRVNGVQTGVASSKLQNKSMYQTSLIAYALSQIMNQNGLDANDSDILSTFISNLRSGIAKCAPDECYTKQEDISDATKQLYGMLQTGTPNDAFNIILNALSNIQSNANSKAKIECGTYIGTSTNTISDEFILQSPAIIPELVIITAGADFGLVILSKGMTAYGDIFRSPGLSSRGVVEFGNDYVKLTYTSGTSSSPACDFVMNSQGGSYSYAIIGKSVDTSSNYPMVLTPVVGKGINLFDNSYFIGGGTSGRFPINQQGQTGESAYPNTGIGIDRWYTVNGAYVGVLPGGVTLYSAIQFGAFCQNVSDQRLTEGAVYTLSIMTNQNLYSLQLVPNKSVAWNGSPYENGFYPYLYWDSVKERWVFALASNANFSGTTQYITIKASKLELGIQQSLARQVNDTWVLNDPPPNYQQELAKCQRYFTVFRGRSYIGYGYVDGQNRVVATVTTPVPMAAISSIVSSGIHAYVIGTGWVNTTGVPAIVDRSANLVTYAISLDSTTPEGSPAFLKFGDETADSNYLLFSAE